MGHEEGASAGPFPEISSPIRLSLCSKSFVPFLNPVDVCADADKGLVALRPGLVPGINVFVVGTRNVGLPPLTA